MDAEFFLKQDDNNYSIAEPLKSDVDISSPLEYESDYESFYHKSSDRMDKSAYIEEDFKKVVDIPVSPKRKWMLRHRTKEAT